MKTIHLRNNKNLRDLGGKYIHVTVKHGMLLRGRALRKLSKRQMGILRDKHHLKTIIDLRDNAEREQAPDIIIPFVTYRPMPVFDDEKVGISHEDRQKLNKYELLRKLPPMEQLYYEMLHEESLVNLGKIIKYIVTAKDDEYAIYFHCSEGKDRTGIVSAIILMMLGVSREEIIKEYLYTNRAAKHRARRYYLLTKYIKLDLLLAQKLYGMFTANKAYITVVFDVIDNEYGSKENFFHEALKLSDEDIEKFKAKMLLK